MQNSFKTLLLLVLFVPFFAFAQDHPTLCSPSPNAVEVKQPDGRSITITGHGNILLSYSRTQDGYTVIKSENGFYEYASLSPSGELISSGIIASDEPQRTAQESIFLQNVPKNLTFNERQKQQIREFHGDTPNDQPHHTPNQGPNIGHGQGDIRPSFPSKGQRKILLILIEYPDLRATYPVSNFEDLMNMPNYNGTGSFRDYFLEVSNGELDLSVDVHGWYMAKNDFEWYGNKNGSGRARTLVAEAVDAAYADGVDFSIYDNDGDGEVDGVFVIHSGPGAEEGSRTEYVWSHRWRLANQFRTYNGVKIDDYAINPETRTSGGKRIVGIGVLCHEFGHLLGLPDLYDTYAGNGESNGLGNWCLMSSGNWLNSERTPAMMSAWCREDLNWVTPKVISEEDVYSIDISNKSHEIYRINTPSSFEYFLLENRQKRGFDAALPGNGLAIWHINRVKVNERTNNRVNADHTNKGVELKEADGKKDLDTRRNRGDAGDLFPGITNNRSFHASSLPNSNLRNGNTSGIEIYEITQNSDSTISFYFGRAPVASFKLDKHHFCINEPITFNNVSQHAVSYEWSISDGAILQEPSPIYKFSEVGSYMLRLQAFAQKGFSTSDSIEIFIHDFAKADFTTNLALKDAIFENISENSNGHQWYIDDQPFDEPEIFKYTFAEAGTYKVSLVATNEGNCSDTISRNISIITETDENPFAMRVKPNPFAESTQLQLYVEDEKNPLIFHVYSMDGRLVFNKEFTVGAGIFETTFNSGNISQGVYLLKVFQGDKVSTFKLVKSL